MRTGNLCYRHFILLWLLFAVSISNEVNGQWKSIYQTNTNVALLPPSPNASSFQKFGLTPVNLQNGLPNVSIPIYEIKAGDISIPISVDYHYTGLKPKDESSWIGLGWNLTVGGCITRIKRGSTDGTRLPGDNYENISPYDSVLHTNVSNPQFLFSTFYNQTYDTEPDIFVFNFPGHQGKFLFINNRAYMGEYERLSIVSLGSDQGFIITDENGTQFRFSIVETTKAKKAQEQDPREPGNGFVSCWQLTSVTSADLKHWVNFYYSVYTHTELNSLLSQTFRVGYSEPSPTRTYACQPVTGSQTLTPNSSYGNYITGQSLNYIKTSELQTVYFRQSSVVRKDVTSGQNALSQIVVAGQNNNPDTVIKKFAFQPGYFGDTTSTLFARLKLHAVYELNDLGDTLNAYSFEYQHEFDNFPNKNTVSMDQWGYYNYLDESIDQASLLPVVLIQTNLQGIKQSSIYPPTVNLLPDTSYSKYGVIKTVHYPTGGFTTFNFEQNKYRIANEQALPTTTWIDTSFANDVFYSPNANSYSSTGGFFKIQNSTKVHLSISRDLWDSLSLPQHSFHKILYIKKYKSYSCFNDSVIPVVPCTFDTVFISKELYSENNSIDSVVLDTGTYTYELSCNSNAMNTSASFLYQVKRTVTYDNQNAPSAPGLRIAMIKDYVDSSNTTPASTRSYIYTDSTNKCSGVLADDPKYNVFTNITSSGCPVYEYSYSGDNNGLYNADLNFQFYYSAVKEYTSDAKGNDYYTEHYFDPMLIYSRIGYTPATMYNGYYIDIMALSGNKPAFEDLSLYDPLEIKNISYQKLSSGYAKQSVSSTKYNIILDTAFTGIKPISLVSGEIPEVALSYWTYNATRISSVWRYPLTKTDITYDTLNTTYTIQTNYQYDLSKRELKRTEETINNGKTIITKYKYPDNYSGVTAAATLKSHNILAPPLETQIWQKTGSDSSLIKGVVNDFDNTALKPSKKYLLFTANPIQSLSNETISNGFYSSLISDSHYREKLSYTYDSHGNVIEILSDSGMNIPVSYVWGYHYLYPVAEITGVRFSSIVSKIDTASIQGITNDSTLISALTPLRSITGAQVKLITYAPFIGPTSQSDINGKTNYYEYDRFNRLMNIKDFEKNILKTYAYSYAAQTLPPNLPPPQSVQVRSINYTGVSGFNAVFTNTNTNQQYTTTLSANSGSSYLTTLPSGTYNVTISKSGNSASYAFYVNCNSLNKTGTSATFNNISITLSTCNVITLDTLQ